jgi:hypothetical protein
MRIIPNPIDSEEQADRWRHRDLERPRDARLVWAERHLVDHALAVRVWRRRRRIVFIEADGRPVDDVVWLEERSRRLRAIAENGNECGA